MCNLKTVLNESSEQPLCWCRITWIPSSESLWNNWVIYAPKRAMLHSFENMKHTKAHCFVYQTAITWQSSIRLGNVLKFYWPRISVFLSQYLTNLMHKICFTYRFLVSIAKREIGHLYNIRLYVLYHSLEEHGQEWSFTFLIPYVMTQLKICVIPQKSLFYNLCALSRVECMYLSNTNLFDGITVKYNNNLNRLMNRKL